MAKIYTPDMTYEKREELQSIWEAQGGSDITSSKALANLHTAIGVNALREAACEDMRNFPNGGEPRFDKDMHYNSTIFGCIEKEIENYIDENGEPSKAHAKEIKHAQNLQTCIRFVMDTTDMSNEQVLALFSGESVGNAKIDRDMTTRLAMIWTRDDEPDFEDLVCALAKVVPQASNKPISTDEYVRVQEIFNPPEGKNLTYEELTHDLHNELESWPLGFNYRQRDYETAPFSAEFATRYEWEKAMAKQSSTRAVPLPKPTSNDRSNEDGRAF